ncbi:MAG TPA: site-2 protease family protein [Thermoanaerobaculia bacterium]|nr:site-2 protease family protein [Thermoanaerobaculia bacterium]
MNPQHPRPQLELLPPAAYPHHGSPLPLQPPPRPHRTHPLLAGLLFLATFVTTTTLGAVFLLGSRTDVMTDILPVLLPDTLRRVWGDPALLHSGLLFAGAALTILLAHEMGHYLACRHYRLPATLPYFLPFPAALGTLGAFIRIKAPLRSKRELFDVGVAGPIAGFVALLPFLAYGVAHSEVGSYQPAEPSPDGNPLLFLPGRSLLFELAVRLFHGPLGPNMALDLHPFALGAWVGLFATALNLLPLGQLDGGHILYAVLGRTQRRLALPFLIGLALGGFYWPGWWVWCVILLILGFRHPPIRDEQTPLDRNRKLLALVALLIFALTFMPVPLQEIIVR